MIDRGGGKAGDVIALISGVWWSVWLQRIEMESRGVEGTIGCDEERGREHAGKSTEAEEASRLFLPRSMYIWSRVGLEDGFF